MFDRGGGRNLMRVPFLATRQREVAIQPLGIEDSPVLARLHQEDFARPWTDGEFASLLKQDTVFGYAALEEGRAAAGPLGFVLARLAADEGEILTVTVARAHRRRGIGRLLLDAVLRRLHTERAAALFLEVDETNMPALTLYRRLGFREAGQRPDYYFVPGVGRRSALVMRRDLR